MEQRFQKVVRGNNMTNYTIWADRGEGAQSIYEVGKYLQQCAGGSVNVLGIGPSVGQSYGLSGGHGTTGVFMTNGVGIATPNDFEMGIERGYYHYDHAIFVWPQYINNQYMSDENIKTHVIPGEWDWNRSSSYNVGGMTAAQWFPQAKHVDLVAGKSPQEIAQKICQGSFVGGSGNSSASSSNSGSGQSNTSPLLTGDMTFEELVGEVCNGIDLLFLVKKSTVVVSDFETIFAEAQYLRDNYSYAVESENIKLYQIEEDSYELEINQHGFYNTVYVGYKDGKIKETYDEFVRVYGEVPITYHDETADKKTAQMKAKAYLAAHLRELEMNVNATIMTDGEIDIGDMVTIENPKTLTNKVKVERGETPELLFVTGLSTNWEGEGYIESDLECKFAPVSPEKKEVPTAGVAAGDNAQNGGAAGSFDSCGVSADGSQIMAIGKPSAVGESQYGYRLYKSVFVRKCPFCGSSELYWGYMWSGNFPCTKKFNNGSAGRSEGHIYCDGCDADFSCIDGKDHMSPPRATLTRISGPTPSTEEEASQLSSGTYNGGS